MSALEVPEMMAVEAGICEDVCINSLVQPTICENEWHWGVGLTLSHHCPWVMPARGKMPPLLLSYHIMFSMTTITCFSLVQYLLNIYHKPRIVGGIRGDDSMWKDIALFMLTVRGKQPLFISNII